NRRRWWFRHKSKETSMEPGENSSDYSAPQDANPALVDHHKSPFETVADHELRARVEEELREVAEPYLTQVSLGTVKSRITRGRDALRKRLTGYIREVGAEIGVSIEQEDGDGRHGIKHARVEVTS
ncbi:MAG: hypothetical protein DMG94_00660, partial [Acidobacteria bacterium]